MFHVALVSDKNSIARSRVQAAYVTPTPTIFIDGGYRNVVGGFPPGGGTLTPYYQPEIEAALDREVIPLNLITSLEWLGNSKVRVHVAVGNGIPANTAPPMPTIQLQSTRVPPMEEMPFSIEVSDPEDNLVFSQWDWGDGQISDWLGPFYSGGTDAETHFWTSDGNYVVRARFRDPFGEVSAWSDPAVIAVSCCTDRVGNANGLGTPPSEVTISDIQLMVTAKFISSLPCEQNLHCLTEADVNQSGGANPACKDITIADIQTLVNHLFIAGPVNAPLKNCL
jgi:hypothetical protein